MTRMLQGFNNTITVLNLFRQPSKKSDNFVLVSNLLTSLDKQCKYNLSTMSNMTMTYFQGVLTGYLGYINTSNNG